MGSPKHEVVLTMNGKGVINVLEAIHQKAKEVQASFANLKGEDLKQAKELFDALNSAEEIVINNTQRLDHAIDNLSKTSLQELRRALGAGKREMAAMSEEQLKQADEIRAKMKIVGDQIRLLEGEYVKIREGVREIGTQSDQWLDKAIKQQKDLVASLSKTDAEYAKEVQLLKQLTDEEERRAAAVAKQKAAKASATLKQNAKDAYSRAAAGNFTGMTEAQLRADKKAMEEYQQTIQMGGEKWNRYGQAIANVETHMKSFRQTQAQVGMDVAQAQQLAQTGKNPSGQAASLNDIKEAQRVMQEYRNTLNDTASIKNTDKVLEQLGNRFNQLNGTTKEATISWRKMREVMNDPKSASGEDIKKSMDAIQQRIAKLPAGSAVVARLRAEYTKLEQVLKGTEKQLVNVNDVIARSKQGKANINELKQAYKQLEEELNKLNTGEQAFIDKQKQMKGLKKHIDEVTGAANKQSGAWNTALKNLTAYVGMFAVFNKAKQMMTDVIKKNLDYSGSLTDIRKVAGMAKEDIDKLSRSLAKIDTRTSTEGLAQLAYQGAKLGMSKYGVEGLAAFARAADQVNVAIGEEMGEEALPALAKMVEVMGLIPKFGVEKAMLATGSAMFKLSTTSTATSGNIVEFSKRLTGMSRTAGITTDQLLALGSAADSMMLMPEVASTAFSKLIAKLQRAPGAIEQSLQMPKGRIAELFEAGNAMQAIVEILESMKAKGNMSALDDVFKDLGSDGARLISVMVTMSKNVDMLKNHLEVSNEAFMEGTAITNEYKMQQESAIGIMERAQNLWEKAFINPDGVDSVKELAQSWYNVSKFLTENQAAMGSMKLTFDALIVSVKLLCYLLPSLLAGLAFKGISAALIGVSKALFGVGEASFIAAVKTKGLRLAWKELNATMKANWVSVLIGLVVELGVVLYETFKTTEKLNESLDDLKKYLADAEGAWDKERRKIDSYIAALNNANTSTEQRRRILNKFKNEYGSYLEKLGIEVKSVGDLQTAYQALNDEIKKKMYYQLRERAYDDKLGTASGKVGDATMAYANYINGDKGSTFGAYDTKWLQEQVNAGKDAKAIYRSMMESVYGAGGYWSNVDDAYVTGQGMNAQTNKDGTIKKLIENFVNAGKDYNKVKKQIDDAFNPIIGDYDPFANETPGALVNNPDDKGGKGGKSDPTSDAKKRANALLANIKAFYEEQRRKYYEWVGEMNKDGEKVSEGQVQQYLSVLEEHEKTATGLARQSIATAGDEWDKFNTKLGEDLFQTASETDIRLLRDIGESNIGELHKLFLKLSADMSKETHTSLAENLGALLDEIFKNGAKDLREAAENVVKRQRAIQAILNQHDYTGAVDRTTRSNFDQLDFLRPAQGVNANTDAGLDKMNDAFDKLTEKARNAVAELYAIDPASTDFQQKFLSFLSVANDGFDFSSQSVQNLKALYLELIKYTDQYTAAQKQQYEYAKKVVNQRWKDNRSNKENQDAQYVNKIQKELFGKQTSFLSNLGMANARDPEIEDYKLKMEAAQEYFAFVQKTSKDHELLDEANKARREAELAYMEQVVKSMKDRAAQLGQFLSPVQEFGEAMGEAFAKMSDDAESADEAIKAALKSMIQSFGKKLIEDVNTQMWQGINNSIAKRQARKAEAEVAESRANAEGNITADLEMERGASAEKPLFVNVVNGEKKSDGAEGSGNIGENGGGTGASATPDASGVNGGSGNGGAATERGNGLARTGARMGSSVGNAIVEGATGGDAGAIGASVVGTALDGLMNADFSTKKSGKSKDEKQEEKARKKALKDERKQAKALAKEKEKGLKDQAKATKKYSKEMTKTTEEGNQEQSKGTQMAQNAIVTAVQTAGTMEIQTKKKNDEQVVKSSGKTAQAETTFSMVGAIAKCFEFLGPIAGPIAAAVVVATLNGLLQWAMSSIFGGSGSDSTASAPTANTKLVSGMLTYDNGNISDLKPFFDKEGNMYWAEEDDSEHKGVSLLTQPTATTINGQPSLVAEQGPELVIGRETTRAMMQNDPQLLRTLYQYDKNHSGRHAFDNGNVSDLEPTVGADGQTIWAESVTASNAALTVAVNALLARLQQPITAKVDMYGRGNLYDSMSKAQQFMKGKF